MKKITIGTRGSKLALWQAEFVRARLEIAFPEIAVKLLIIKTEGDKIQNVPLTEIGGRGVFTKELEIALLDGRIDLAVHSLKDLPTNLPENLKIAAVLEREDARDALILRTDLTINNLSDLPLDCIIGTSSLRRAAQLKNLRPDVQIKDIRGNVDSRLRKLDAGEYDGILLAVAGLKRLSLAHRITLMLSSAEMMPQVGQGALAIEIRRDDQIIFEKVSILNHAETFAAVTAERAFLRGLGGGCQFPIASFGEIVNSKLFLRGLVAAPDGSQILRGETDGEIGKAEEIGNNLAFDLLHQGADNLIHAPA